MTSDDVKPSRGSWRIVWRALRVGHVDDPRYAALTWQTADRNVRNSWLLVFFAICLAFQVVLVVVRLARGDEWSNTVATAATAMCVAVGLGFLLVARQRSKRYLERNGGPPRPGSGQGRRI